MFKVFISASSLEKICIDEMSKEEQLRSDWFKILTQQNVIYLDKNIYDEWDYGDPLFFFSESYNVNFKMASCDYNEEISQNPMSVLNNPQGAYLLDVTPEDAVNLQNAFGVICQSTGDLSNCALTETPCKITAIEGDSEDSWKDLFATTSPIPSNSLIIVDRYIFSYEAEHRSNYIDGIRNIEKILDHVLPLNLGCEYHVLILFDYLQTKDRNFSVEDVYKKLEWYKQNVLKRPYEIVFELVSITHKCIDYDISHNRHIFSNYFTVSAQHLLKAFNKNGQAICTQNIDIEYLYSHGLSGRSSAGTKLSNEMIRRLNRVYSTGIIEHDSGGVNANQYVLFGSDGQSHSFHQIQNRLMKMKL